MRAPIPPRAYVYELFRGDMSLSMLLYAVADVQRGCGWWMCLMPHVTRHTSHVKVGLVLHYVVRLRNQPAQRVTCDV